MSRTRIKLLALAGILVSTGIGMAQNAAPESPAGNKQQAIRKFFEKATRAEKQTPPAGGAPKTIENSAEMPAKATGMPGILQPGKGLRSIGEHDGRTAPGAAGSAQGSQRQDAAAYGEPTAGHRLFGEGYRNENATLVPLPCRESRRKSRVPRPVRLMNNCARNLRPCSRPQHRQTSPHPSASLLASVTTPRISAASTSTSLAARQHRGTHCIFL